MFEVPGGIIGTATEKGDPERRSGNDHLITERALSRNVCCGRLFTLVLSGIS
jgi:hypothetical protein